MKKTGILFMLVSCAVLTALAGYAGSSSPAPDRSAAPSQPPPSPAHANPGDRTGGPTISSKSPGAAKTVPSGNNSANRLLPLRPGMAFVGGPAKRNPAAIAGKSASAKRNTATIDGGDITRRR